MQTCARAHAHAQEELGIVRSLLQRTQFEPSHDHMAVMESFREGEPAACQPWSI